MTNKNPSLKQLVEGKVSRHRQIVVSADRKAGEKELMYHVHRVGGEVPSHHVKVGDRLRSSDLDDLQQGGYSVHELKAAPPKSK